MFKVGFVYNFKSEDTKKNFGKASIRNAFFVGCIQDSKFKVLDVDFLGSVSKVKVLDTNKIIEGGSGLFPEGYKLVSCMDYARFEEHTPEDYEDSPTGGCVFVEGGVYKFASEQDRKLFANYIDGGQTTNNVNRKISDLIGDDPFVITKMVGQDVTAIRRLVCNTNHVAGEGWFKEACALLIKSDNPYFKNIKDVVEPKQEESAANFKHYAIVKGMNVQLVSHSYEEIATEAKKMKEEYPISTVEIYERIGVVSIEPTAVIK